MISLLAPTKAIDKRFKNICEVLGKHHYPKPSVIVYRYKFNICVRKQGVSVASYVPELRKLSEYCEYGTNIDEMIRERIVLSMMTEHSVIFSRSRHWISKKALEIAQSMEIAAKNSIDLHATQSQVTSNGICSQVSNQETSLQEELKQRSTYSSQSF